MSEKKFQEARKGLAVSQNLLDSIRGQQNMAQPQSESPSSMEDQQANPVPAPVDNQPPVPQVQQGIEQAVKDTIAPYMEEIKTLIDEQSKETKQVEVKLDGEMSPKE